MSNLKYNKLFTKSMLEEDYKVLHSMKKIAQKYNVSINTITRYMDKFDIPRTKFLYEFTNIFDQNTEASFYLAGFIAADGNVYRKRLKISLRKKDRSHLEKIKLLLLSTHPITIDIDKYGYESCSFIIWSSPLMESLKRFNILPNKTFTYTFPEWLINHPLVHHFMRGYWDGDGCFSLKKPQIKTGRTVPQMISFLRGTKQFLTIYDQVLTRNTNITPTNRVRKYDSTCRIVYSGNNLSKEIANFLYRDHSICLEYKYHIIKNWLI